jgi:hypothetical protein
VVEIRNGQKFSGGMPEKERTCQAEAYTEKMLKLEGERQGVRFWRGVIQFSIVTFVGLL